MSGSCIRGQFYTTRIEHLIHSHHFRPIQPARQYHHHRRNLPRTNMSTTTTACATTATETAETAIANQQQWSYHGRIVATPLPDSCWVSQKNKKNTAAGTMVVDATTVANDPSTMAPTTGTSTSSHHHPIAPPPPPPTTPLRRRPNRSTTREIDTTSVHRAQQGYGPTYYQPQQHYDWCWNTASTASTTSTTSTHSTSSTDSFLYSEDNPNIHSSSSSNNNNNKPEQPNATNNTMNCMDHIPSSSVTQVDVYLYNQYHRVKHKNTPRRTQLDGTATATATATTDPRYNKNTCFQLCRPSHENVMDTIQRIIIKYVQKFVPHHHPTSSTSSSSSPLLRMDTIQRMRNDTDQPEPTDGIPSCTKSATQLLSDAVGPKASSSIPQQQQKEHPRYSAQIWLVQTSLATTATTDHDPTLVVTTPTTTSTTNHIQFLQQIDTTNLTNVDFWKLGFESPLAVTVQLEADHDDNDNDGGGHRLAPTNSCFLLECYPPTIYSVATFNCWGTYLYVGVPVSIQVTTWYATHSRVDWYVDGRWYQTTWDDSNHIYIPLVTHINRKVTLLVTPCRISSKNDHNNTNHTIASPNEPWNIQCHTGIGCEKAYRFHKLVTALPTNTILQCRSQWLKNTSTTPPARATATVADTATTATTTTTTTTTDQYSHPRDTIQSHNGTTTNQRSTIRVLTYNILADTNAYQLKKLIPTYPYVTQEILNRDRRFPLIVHEILAYDADVICLQEVEYPVYETLLLPILQHYNYQGYYSAKRSDTSLEGCAMFWSLRTFASVPLPHQRTIVIRDLLMHGYNTRGTSSTTTDDEWSTVYDNLWSLLLRRPDIEILLATKLAHVAQMVPLTLLDDTPDGTDHRVVEKRTTARPPLWITNTHLYYHPQASHIRLLQMLLLARQITSEVQKQPGELIMCGDFNSSLRHSAGKLLLDRTVPANFGDSQLHLNAFRDTHLTPADDVVCTTSSATWEDDFPSFSLPRSFPILQSGIEPSPLFTHCTHEFRGTLDHILFSSGKLRYQSSAPMPSIEDVTVATAMPSPNIPSDHVSLICDLVVDYEI
jgi:mRNA deadenylase 3'-5' endonuclease subunit Ccr4